MYKRKFNMIPVLFLLPSVIFLLIFVYFPLIQNFYNSFFDFSVFSKTKSFVGLDHFKELLTDKVVSVSLLNNIKYIIISVILQVGFALVLAYILEDKVFSRFAPFFRVVYFIPVMISISVIALLFGFVYNPQMGILNSFLELIGLDSLAEVWLGNSTTAIYAVIAMSQWQSIGFITMLFIVSIQKIPKDMYEAAEIDGAGKIRKFFSITVPQVREAIFVNTLITITGSMLVFNEPYILTNGGPGFSSMTMSVHMYQTGFVKDNMGYASTLAIIIFILTAVLALVQIRISRTGKGD
ncbi:MULTISPECIES: carbohydrate ABC transporter permease [Heyndrickxia]|uniref:ABC transporter permease n=1 Tax=Heyndrickxia oleronia TaxID=38875 RepID=A0A8E2IB62_9BACI|nr:sugar ABC transporter permease [Heyndrickxia oleronia]NYV65057.1 sugar ABC transporter permease [Bacillus sp. Gen3]OJH20340.1 ABC transporter permease [Bacillus obstructivus]MBU5214156.1 sugar ABC transporter permease [Heyndrickxia oleronia]MCI1589243.1 sugar ABC transporter permease [Heyndrickxia oleronia]MCI1611774.1 sugar ABC transporter permease [Heyndrickxia oleronia]